ncbi:Por secretion system C-terminal sorting domain-containing protein [Flavobacterium resistens]|uniref:Por secretion system C-terminal sorting domain-containing protein n=1 Tax=Flavobacterium resistens TaxID=443612 RepID=A0A521CW06_9FLAO|nr:T9SS type A sorting domain-containing protein [Flavobacterium resistens]MRX67045.1 T9SS type A sorting domain-containing protein [Flavobacterium resistens]SMO63626.1 Por secretion system C-terminal sorting domain-containing protein [Flavobacterium resistens]
MKNVLIFLFLCFITFSTAQNKLKFTYDNLTGNQINRTLCINCASAKPSKDNNAIQAVSDEDLLKFSPTDVISYYPNPVKEELFIKWDLIDENYVTSIQVIGINGQVLTSYNCKKEINSQNIPFQNLPTGVYIVSLEYNNREQKTIKIIKQ